MCTYYFDALFISIYYTCKFSLPKRWSMEVHCIGVSVMLDWGFIISKKSIKFTVGKGKRRKRE